MKEVSDKLQNTYDNQYKDSDAQWRLLGGKQKADNIIRLCNSLKFESMLDVGSGDGAVLSYLNDEKFCSNINSIEISDSGIEKIKDRKMDALKSLEKFDGYKIPHANHSFDLSTCSHVLEHVEHPRLLLREIARVSKYQFFEIPIDFAFFVDNKIKHYLDYGHINIFTPSLFKFLLKSEGFTILKEDFVFMSNDQIQFAFKGQILKQWKQILRNKIISATPYKKVKPNAYIVLCEHDGKGLQIF